MKTENSEIEYMFNFFFHIYFFPIFDSLESVCFLPKEPGPCQAYIPKFFYNIESKKCENFIYGGCRGNGNNFKHLEECWNTCVQGKSRDMYS